MNIIKSLTVVVTDNLEIYLNRTHRLYQSEPLYKIDNIDIIYTFWSRKYFPGKLKVCDLQHLFR